jgi:ornithine cyclodeaminase/alanine dehydrogenase-like protein (mu-crystallin family)
MTLRVVGLDDIRAVVTKTLVFDAVRDALIAHAEHRTQQPPPMHLVFPDMAGDCHVKAGHMAGAPHFAVKVAAGFYRNPDRGLPSNSGLILVLDAANGVPAAVLADQGWLTAWRTAAAGALITHALTPPDIDTVGVLGTGQQARLQVEWLHALRPLAQILVWGRRRQEAQRICAELSEMSLDARPATIEEAAKSACVITTTPSMSPLAPDRVFASARHITGIGTDLPGKAELPAELFSRATIIATDDHTQCLDHGDFGNAVRAGAASAESDTAVGVVLRDGVTHGTGLTIADLTGLGVADAAVASAVWSAVLAATAVE